MMHEETTSEELRDERGRVLSGNSHSCPKCGAVGRVFHSHPRTLSERIRLFISPKHGLYRCHDCNWRGWKVRSKSTPMGAVLRLTMNILLMLIALGIIVFLIWDILPMPSQVP